MQWPKKKTKGQTTIYKIVYRKQKETHCSGSMNLQDFSKITISNKDTQSQKNYFRQEIQNTLETNNNVYTAKYL
jgi:hypothetical protein